MSDYGEIPHVTPRSFSEEATEVFPKETPGSKSCVFQASSHKELLDDIKCQEELLENSQKEVQENFQMYNLRGIPKNPEYIPEKKIQMYLDLCMP